MKKQMALDQKCNSCGNDRFWNDKCKNCFKLDTMKKLVVDLCNKLEAIQKSNPKLFRVGYIILWCVAPIEMLCIKMGIFGYKKFKMQYQMSREEQEDLR